MITLKIAKGLGYINDDLISDAVAYKRSNKDHVWIKRVGVAACFCLIITGAFLASRGGLFSRVSTDADTYQVLLTNNHPSGFQSQAIVRPVSVHEGLSVPIGQEAADQLAIFIASDEAQNTGTETMSIEEAKEYAYLDYDSASSELKERILEARKVIIFTSDWVADGYSGCIQNVETGEVIKTLPSFSELFPGWDIPIVDSPKSAITEDGLGADSLYGLPLTVLVVNESSIVGSTPEPMNLFEANQKITVFVPQDSTIDPLSLKIGDALFVSYYGKDCSVLNATIYATSITKD